MDVLVWILIGFLTSWVVILYVIENQRKKALKCETNAKNQYLLEEARAKRIAARVERDDQRFRNELSIRSKENKTITERTPTQETPRTDDGTFDLFTTALIMNNLNNASTFDSSPSYDSSPSNDCGSSYDSGSSFDSGSCDSGSSSSGMD